MCCWLELTGGSAPSLRRRLTLWIARDPKTAASISKILAHEARALIEEDGLDVTSKRQLDVITSCFAPIHDLLGIVCLYFSPAQRAEDPGPEGREQVSEKAPNRVEEGGRSHGRASSIEDASGVWRGSVTRGRYMSPHR